MVDKNSPLALLGYMVQDAGKDIGIIQEVIEQPHQLMVTILYRNSFKKSFALCPVIM
jgi:hypothetical protein